MEVLERYIQTRESRDLYYPRTPIKRGQEEDLYYPRTPIKRGQEEDLYYPRTPIKRGQEEDLYYPRTPIKRGQEEDLYYPRTPIKRGQEEEATSSAKAPRLAVVSKEGVEVLEKYIKTRESSVYWRNISRLEVSTLPAEY